MAATLQFCETNGPAVSPVVTDNISNLNFGRVDAPNLDPTSYSIPAGQASYGKWIRLKLSAMGGSSWVANYWFWKSSGAYKTGEVVGTNTTWGNDDTAPYGYAASQQKILVYGNSCNMAPVAGAPVSLPVTDAGYSVFGYFSYANMPVHWDGPTYVYSVNVYCHGAMGASMNAGDIAAGTNYTDYIYLGLITTLATPLGALNQKVFTVSYIEGS